MSLLEVRVVRLSCAFFLFLAAAAVRANTITVNSTADVVANDGQCTLREALIAANTNTASGAAAGECAAGSAGLDTIAFNIPGSGVHTITPASNLPTLTEPVFIDGYTQGGSSANTAAFPAALNTVLTIELNLSTSFLSIDAAGSTVRGLAINRGVDNITINANTITIRGNFIGTDPTGTMALPNATGGFGIRTNGARNGAIIGGPGPADRNLISGDRQGGIIGSLAGGTGILIQGNFIGPDKTGMVALTTAGAGLVNISDTMVLNNLISGNNQGGIAMGVSGGGNNTVQGNLIGTQANGTSALPNGNFGGIDIASSNNLIGGTAAGQGNVIAFNTGFGIDFGISNATNVIEGNSIFGNSFKGINENGLATPTTNDNCDADSFQNYPVITSAVVAAGNVTISGTFNSTASTTFRLEFFSNAVCDSSGNGQGQTFLGSTNVTTGAGCTTTFGPLVFPDPSGQAIFTATATAPGTKGTSEFSACFPLGVVGTPTPTPTPTPTSTPTSTPGAATATPTRTSTPTPAPTGGAAVVPTLSPGSLVILGLALALAALLLMRRSG